ncbi:cation:proton antiporter subunit C [Insolitispirillum peregrinum]|uniref:Multisubunit sodium/proton antiporter, MrpC subunit n=1 Tax=Insolitispirillum peregrinum TaxID=80876 RepID=A0A1N7NGY7_9PROT|nr:cation:proton antiporter subunit C [Insolitispirillum peregrinum]SIS97518.1 multisubunit sodium/proton antiporter, MrpC subunit [Insolitispirillum peregrinum]
MSWTSLIDHAIGHYNYWVCVVLMMLGFYIVIASGNLIKKIIGLNLFQTAVIMFYISMGKIDGGTAPILVDPEKVSGPVVYTNPLPSVLMLTAIVVGVATSALGLALVVRIKEAYGSIEEDEILAADRASDAKEQAQYAASAAQAAKTEAAQQGHA